MKTKLAPFLLLALAACDARVKLDFAERPTTQPGCRLEIPALKTGWRRRLPPGT